LRDLLTDRLLDGRRHDRRRVRAAGGRAQGKDDEGRKGPKGPRDQGTKGLGSQDSRFWVPGF
jgi:hypothetical protein